MEHELARFKVKRDLNGFWNFVEAALEKSLEKAGTHKDNETVSILGNALKNGRH